MLAVLAQSTAVPAAEVPQCRMRITPTTWQAEPADEYGDDFEEYEEDFEADDADDAPAPSKESLAV